MALSLADQYATLITTFQRCRETASQGGRTQDAEALRESARAIFRFEHLHELPKLWELSATIGALSARLERAQAELRRFASRRKGREHMVLNGIGTGEDQIPNALDLLALERICDLGARAIQPIQAQFAQLSETRSALISKHRGAEWLGDDPIPAERGDFIHLDPEGRR